MVARWTVYRPQGPWSAKYRVLDHFLEVELETVSRAAPESEFTLDIESFFPSHFVFDIEKVEFSVSDNYIGECILMGSRVPGHWKRNVSMVVRINPHEVSYA